MTSRFAIAAVMLVVVVGLTHAQPLTERNYKSYKSYLVPKASELAWEKVDWYPSYWDGVLQAHKKKKPILVWAMNGHPLGCT